MTKYARPELERRFLLDGVPPGEAACTTRIADRYIVGTRLRLRRMTTEGTAGYKLTQKLPRPDGMPGLITTIYLDAGEHAVLAMLPADVIEKTRLHMPPLAVDVFDPPLDLVVAEVEFESEEEMAAYRPPDFVVREITGDPGLAGAALAARLSPARPRPPRPGAP